MARMKRFDVRRQISLAGTKRRRGLELLTPGQWALEDRMLPAVITAFAPRFSANDNGDILFVANTVLTAPSTDSDAANARNGVGTWVNNNDFSMVYVDVDGNSTTFNSSQATLVLPAGGTVLFAGLY